VILNPAVAGNIRGDVVISRRLLGRHLTSQEESHPDQERHAHNQRRGQCRQVREHGSLLSADLLLNQFTWPDHLITAIRISAAPALRRTYQADLCILTHDQSTSGNAPGVLDASSGGEGLRGLLMP
jgi:hypothetical protein